MTGTGENKRTYNLKPEYIVKEGGFVAPELQIPGRDVFIKLSAINASEGAIRLKIILEEDEDTIAAVDMLGVEISKKPLILILWLGCLVLLAGTFLSLYHRKEKSA